MTSRKKKAWARAKHTLLKGLDGDVWSRASRKHKGDNNDHGWEDNDIDKGEEEDLMARYSQKAIFALNLCVLVYRWYMNVHTFSYGAGVFPPLAMLCNMLGSVGN